MPPEIYTAQETGGKVHQIVAEELSRSVIRSIRLSTFSIHHILMTST